MLADKELQSLRNLGNEAEAAADEIERLRWDLGELRGRIAQMERDEGKALAAERERWQRIAANAQVVTTGCEDKLDYFEVPSHLMAALALALDEGPNLELSRQAGREGA